MDGSANDAELVRRIAESVLARLGPGAEQAKDVVAIEVAAILQERPDLRTPGSAAPSHEMVVVSATGRNRAGILARLATTVEEFAGDVREVSQTIVADYFTLVFLVDITRANNKGAHLSELQKRLADVATELGIHVVAFHDDILASMTV